MINEELKPSNQEKAQWVVEMLNSAGWKIIGQWLNDQRSAASLALEDSKDDTRYWQGQIAVYKSIFNKLKGYTDAAQTRKQ